MPTSLSCDDHCPPDYRDLVLASSSPRRRELLRMLGLPFQTDPSDAPEAIQSGLDVHAIVTALAIDKARAVAGRHQTSLVIAADTLVALDSRLFGKPRDASEAGEMLSALSGASHRVITGVVVLDAATMALETRSVETEVRFRELSASEIDAYVRTGEPLDKAGAYGIQGVGAVFVERIVGDYFNVVGLPLAALNELLRSAGCCIVCRRLQASAPA